MMILTAIATRRHKTHMAIMQHRVLRDEFSGSSAVLYLKRGSSSISSSSVKLYLSTGSSLTSLILSSILSSNGRVSSVLFFLEDLVEEGFFFFGLPADLVGLLVILVGTMAPAFLERLVRFAFAGMVNCLSVGISLPDALIQ